jgi:hypothetical protein
MIRFFSFLAGFRPDIPSVPHKRESTSVRSKKDSRNRMAKASRRANRPK